MTKPRVLGGFEYPGTRMFDMPPLTYVRHVPPLVCLTIYLETFQKSTEKGVPLARPYSFFHFFFLIARVCHVALLGTLGVNIGMPFYVSHDTCSTRSAGNATYYGEENGLSEHPGFTGVLVESV